MDMLTMHISSIRNSEDLIILGNFNVPTTFKQENTDSLERLTAYTSCSKAAVLYEFIGGNNIEFHNTIKNVQGIRWT